jgi:hypothetical protein
MLPCLKRAGCMLEVGYGRGYDVVARCQGYDVVAQHDMHASMTLHARHLVPSIHTSYSANILISCREIRCCAGWWISLIDSQAFIS